MSSRKNQKQIWADIKFIKKLEVIKARKIIAGDPIGNIGEITRKIIECKSFEDIEQEIINKSSNNNIQFDAIIK